MKATFTMGGPVEKSNSVQFRLKDLETLEHDGQTYGPENLTDAPSKVKAAASGLERQTVFYIPRPFAESARKLRVTIEEI
jgi:hypothetical protein